MPNHRSFIFMCSAVFGGSLAFTVPAVAAPPSPSLKTGLVSAQCVMKAYKRLGEALSRCERLAEAKPGPRKFEVMCVFTAHFQHSLDVGRCDDLGLDLGDLGKLDPKL